MGGSALTIASILAALGVVLAALASRREERHGLRPRKAAAGSAVVAILTGSAVLIGVWAALMWSPDRSLTHLLSEAMGPMATVSVLTFLAGLDMYLLFWLLPMTRSIAISGVVIGPLVVGALFYASDETARWQAESAEARERRATELRSSAIHARVDVEEVWRTPGSEGRGPVEALRLRIRWSTDARVDRTSARIGLILVNPIDVVTPSHADEPAAVPDILEAGAEGAFELVIDTNVADVGPMERLRHDGPWELLWLFESTDGSDYAVTARFEVPATGTAVSPTP